MAPGSIYAAQPAREAHIGVFGLGRIVKLVGLPEEVGVIGIGEDHVGTLGSGNTTLDGGAISARSHVNNPRAVGGGDARRAVAAAIIGDDNFLPDSCFFERLVNFVVGTSQASFPRSSRAKRCSGLSVRRPRSCTLPLRRASFCGSAQGVGLLRQHEILGAEGRMNQPRFDASQKS